MRTISLVETKMSGPVVLKQFACPDRKEVDLGGFWKNELYDAYRYGYPSAKLADRFNLSLHAMHRVVLEGVRSILGYLPGLEAAK